MKKFLCTIFILLAFANMLVAETKKDERPIFYNVLMVKEPNDTNYKLYDSKTIKNFGDKTYWHYLEFKSIGSFYEMPVYIYNNDICVRYTILLSKKLDWKVVSYYDSNDEVFNKEYQDLFDMWKTK